MKATYEKLGASENSSQNPHKLLGRSSIRSPCGGYCFCLTISDRQTARTEKRLRAKHTSNCWPRNWRTGCCKEALTPTITAQRQQCVQALSSLWHHHQDYPTPRQQGKCERVFCARLCFPLMGNVGNIILKVVVSSPVDPIYKLESSDYLHKLLSAPKSHNRNR